VPFVGRWIVMAEIAENTEENEEQEESEGTGGGSDSEQTEASLDEILAKKAEGDSPEEESDDESMLSMGREERVETLAVKVVPQQPTEFVCKSCFLVKHRSQLADKKRMFCRDCV
jgi:hypothetical protein